MLKVAMHFGRPYVCFVPAKLATWVSALDGVAGAGRFEMPCEACGAPEESWLAGIHRAIYLDRTLEPSALSLAPMPVLSAGVLADLKALSRRRRWRTSDVLEINHCVMGLSARPRLRKGAMWIGSQHPADACYVAPPATDIPALMADLVEFCSSARWSALVKGLVAMQQLLLIHPFEDGNGRTARALMLCLAGIAPASTAVSLEVIEELWRFKQLRLLAIQQHVRNGNNWAPLFEVLGECVSRRVGSLDGKWPG